MVAEDDKIEEAPVKAEAGQPEENATASDNGAKRRGGRRERRRGNGGKDRRDERDHEYSETLIDIYRCSATVKGGRRLSFGALVTVGNSKGRVGIGYAKAKEVPGAIQKASKKAHSQLIDFVVAEGDTVPHQIQGQYGASRVILIPARPGTGVIAGASVKAILEAGGLKNVLTKCIGNTNTRNMVKATMNALSLLRSRETVAQLRQVEL